MTTSWCLARGAPFVDAFAFSRSLQKPQSRSATRTAVLTGMVFWRNSKSDEKGDRVADSIAALQTLQQTLHLLTPLEQSEIKKALPFASTEWLDGLALSVRPQAPEGSVYKITASPDAAMSHSKGLVLRKRLTKDATTLIIVLVGLPARGKSLLGHKLEAFLIWRGYNTKTFRVGKKRRDMANNASDDEARPESGSASFFDSSKAYASMVREKVSMNAFDEALSWLIESEGQIAIFDASNVTIKRRAAQQQAVREKLEKAGLPADTMGLVFVETIVTDPMVIQQGMDWKIAHSADFRGMRAEDAMRDLQDRIIHYEKIYETLREEEGAYIKMFNLKAKAHACNIYGRMAKSVLPYLLSIHSLVRPIYILVVNEGAIEDLPGIDLVAEAAETSEIRQAKAAVVKWAKALPAAPAKELAILTSTSAAAQILSSAVAQAAGCDKPERRPQLEPIRRASSSVGSSFREQSTGVKQTFANKFGDRVERLVLRIEPVALELEAATGPVLVVAGEAACRTLRSFLMPPSSSAMADRETVDEKVDIKEDGMPTLFEFTPKAAGGFEEQVQVLTSSWLG